MDHPRAERYLRERSEEHLLDRSPDEDHGLRHDDPLEQQARTLVDVGALDVDTAQQVLDEYRRALRLRGRVEQRHDDDSDDSDEPGPIRVARLGATVTTATLTAHLGAALLSADRTVLMGDVELSHAAGPGWRPRGPLSLAVRAEDRPPDIDAHFSGATGASVWDGRFVTQLPLPMNTQSITVNGAAIDLGDPAADVVVTAIAHSELSIDERVRTYLAGLEDNRHSPGVLARAVETLVGAGVVTPDSPVVADAFAVRAGASRPRPHRPPARRLRRRYLGVATPVLDRMTVVALELEDHRHGPVFQVVVLGAAFHGSPDLRRARPTFSARDDAGREYPVVLGPSSSSDDYLCGQLELAAPLHDDAHRLDLVVAARTCSAVIAVPLVWDET